MLKEPVREIKCHSPGIRFSTIFEIPADGKRACCGEGETEEGSGDGDTDGGGEVDTTDGGGESDSNGGGGDGDTKTVI